LCHYAEPAEDTMATLDAILKLDYPCEKLHIYICDDGAFKSKFSPGNPIPEISINQSVIENAGDVR
jgi:hypothetical protein